MRTSQWRGDTSCHCATHGGPTLQAAGVDVVFKQNGSRRTDFRRGRQLGPRDHLVRWSKPRSRPEWMTPEQFGAFPEQLTVREVKVEGRVIVTTMRNVIKGELAELYGQRWHVELDLRNIKTTLGMDVLSYPWLKISRAQARWRIAVHGHA